MLRTTLRSAGTLRMASLAWFCPVTKLRWLVGGYGLPSAKPSAWPLWSEPVTVTLSTTPFAPAGSTDERSKVTSPVFRPAGVPVPLRVSSTRVGVVRATYLIWGFADGDGLGLGGTNTAVGDGDGTASAWSSTEPMSMRDVA